MSGFREGWYGLGRHPVLDAQGMRVYLLKDCGLLQAQVMLSHQRNGMGCAVLPMRGEVLAHALLAACHMAEMMGTELEVVELDQGHVRMRKGSDSVDCWLCTVRSWKLQETQGATARGG